MYFTTIAIGEKVSTMTPEWKAANKEYMKFQKMNPITGEPPFHSTPNTFNYFTSVLCLYLRDFTFLYLYIGISKGL